MTYPAAMIVKHGFSHPDGPRALGRDRFKGNGHR
jgi:hypothetical protein